MPPSYHKTYFSDAFLSFRWRVANLHSNQNVLPCEMLLPSAFGFHFFTSDTFHFTSLQIYITKKNNKQTNLSRAHSRSLTHAMAWCGSPMTCLYVHPFPSNWHDNSKKQCDSHRHDIYRPVSENRSALQRDAVKGEKWHQITRRCKRRAEQVTN
jgi:hypothetical protein